MNNYWLRRKWVDGRAGHTIYLMFPLSIMNFILIAYRFLVEKDQLFMDGIPGLVEFGIFFILSYIPISIIIGYWHRKTQLTTDNEIKFKEFPAYAKIVRTLLDVATDRASKEEIERFRKKLSDIEKK